MNEPKKKFHYPHRRASQVKEDFYEVYEEEHEVTNLEKIVKII